MGRIVSKMTVHFECKLTLTEGEARALHVLTEYGTDEFIDKFYTKLGKYYLEPYEPSLRSLFSRITSDLGPQLYEVTKARKAIADAMKPKDPK